MSAFAAAALQSALFTRLSTEPALTGVAIFDAPEPGPLPTSYIRLGTGKMRDLSGVEARHIEHSFTVQIVTEGGGFTQIKLFAAAVDLALGAPLTVAGQSVQAQFVKAEAKVLSSGAARRVDLIYRAFIGA